MVRWVGLAAALFLTLCGNAAQAEGRIKVGVRATGDDSIGRQFAFHVRDQIGRSGMFVEDKAGVLRVLLVTLDPDTGGPVSGTRTIYSYTIVIAGGEDRLDSYLTSGVGICGASRVQSCASDLFTVLGEQVETIRAALESKSQAF